MHILDFDYDLEQGFVWIEVEGAQRKDSYTIQCCVDDNSKKIKMSDCGHNWGLCSDANEKAFEFYGENRCMTALYAKAKEDGFEVVA